MLTGMNDEAHSDELYVPNVESVFFDDIPEYNPVIAPADKLTWSIGAFIGVGFPIWKAITGQWGWWIAIPIALLGCLVGIFIVGFIKELVVAIRQDRGGMVYNGPNYPLGQSAPRGGLGKQSRELHKQDRDLYVRGEHKKTLTVQGLSNIPHDEAWHKKASTAEQLRLLPEEWHSWAQINYADHLAVGYGGVFVINDIDLTGYTVTATGTPGKTIPGTFSESGDYNEINLGHFEATSPHWIDRVPPENVGRSTWIHTWPHIQSNTIITKTYNEEEVDPTLLIPASCIINPVAGEVLAAGMPPEAYITVLVAHGARMKQNWSYVDVRNPTTGELYGTAVLCHPKHVAEFLTSHEETIDDPDTLEALIYHTAVPQ